MKNEEILSIFLKNHRKLTAFKANVKNLASPCNYGGNTDRRNLDCKEAIYDAFIWDLSDDGWNYWRGLSDKWRRLCKDFELKGKIDITRL